MKTKSKLNVAINTAICISLFCFSFEKSIGHLFAQNNLLILDGAYIILDGGTSVENIYFVLDQNNTSGIIRTGNGGHISSEGQYNFIKWNSGTSIGSYIFPFGVEGNAADYIPFTFNKTTAGNSNISMSTWTSNSLNVPWAGVSNVPAVTNMNITGSIDLSVPSVIDRWWDIRSSSPVTADLTFSYRGSENTTAVPADIFQAQHWNGAAWDSQAGPGNPGVTAGIGTVGPILGQNTFSPWILTKNGLAITTTSQNLLCNGECTGLAEATVAGGTSYTYYWNPGGQTTQTITGLCIGTYTVIVTDNTSNVTIASTITIIQPVAVDATISSTKTTIIAGDSTQLSTGVGYSYVWTPVIGLSCITCNNPIAKPILKTNYCVQVTDTNGCKDSACIIIDIEEPCGVIFIPNVFSPNDDGQNDLECVFGSCIQHIRFIIFNRWGEKVFETTDSKKCWDGTHLDNNQQMNSEVFVYYLEAIFTNGDEIIKKGNIALIR